MYALIWRLLPGPLLAKVVGAGGLLAAVVVLLFTVVFPWAEPQLPFPGVVTP